MAKTSPTKRTLTTGASTTSTRKNPVPYIDTLRGLVIVEGGDTSGGAALGQARLHRPARRLSNAEYRPGIEPRADQPRSLAVRMVEPVQQ